MDIIGYSERGVLNALFYDVAGTDSPSSMLAALLAQATFPHTALPLPLSDDVEVLIEQSFSDFGDADALLLIQQAAGDDETERTAVFIEAKVKTAQRTAWHIADEFARFTHGVDADAVHSSNLFTQLYHKQRLVEELQSCGVEGVAKGVAFPKCSSKSIRKIGKNPVVRRATELLSRHLGANGRAFYLAIVPGDQARVGQFFTSVLPGASSRLNAIGPWNTTRLGYLTWEQVEAFCVRAGLKKAQKVFAFNREQIYSGQVLI